MASSIGHFVNPRGSVSIFDLFAAFRRDITKQGNGAIHWRQHDPKRQMNEKLTFNISEKIIGFVGVTWGRDHVTGSRGSSFSLKRENGLRGSACTGGGPYFAFLDNGCLIIKSFLLDFSGRRGYIRSSIWYFRLSEIWFTSRFNVERVTFVCNTPARALAPSSLILL